jgi:hypothetical protein
VKYSLSGFFLQKVGFNTDVVMMSAIRLKQ